MNAVTLNDAKQNLEALIEQTVANAEATIICTDKGQRVVFFSLEEFSSWQETLYLLSNPTNAEHLRHSIVEANQVPAAAPLGVPNSIPQ